VGIGVGAFEDAFRIHETGELLGPRYLNMAHNDWLQWLIEAGLPGALLLLALLDWLGFRLWRLRQVSHSWFVLGLVGCAIIALASYFDYPLRTPLFQVAAVWFVCALALVERRPVRESDDLAGNRW
jgi:O-antigen ligase